MPKFIAEQLKELDAPIPSPKWIKAKKIRVIIINEDLSFKEFFAGYPKSYAFEIKNRAYILVPKCVIRGVYPTIVYFFNNPFPLFLDFSYSKLTALDLRNDTQKAELGENQKSILQNTFLDAETLNLAFNTRVMKGLYSESGFTTKNLIILMVVVVVLILVFLQIFGVVDVWGMITGAGAKK